MEDNKNERSSSQMKLLKTYLRTTMSEERLSALAIIKIRKKLVHHLDRDSLVQTFANTHIRRMLRSYIIESSSSLSSFQSGCGLY